MQCFYSNFYHSCIRFLVSLEKFKDPLLEMDSDSEQEVQVKRKVNGGSFKTMGLLNSVLKAIQKRGYMNPTPVQRKTIPLLLEGRDVVGMARTGSGKTAAFIIPMIQKLKVHSAKVGIRGIVLSPSRELAMQSMKYCHEISKYTDLRCISVVGGEKMEDQFAAIATNPDIVVATPGRLLHLIVETGLSLKTVEYIVFDEADRLFEMGFAAQLNELLTMLPKERQTALFSATLPKDLIEFAKAGLLNPELIRLDLETKISPELEMVFIAAKSDSKEASLLYLLQNVISADSMTIVFAATKHHVEYLQELLKAYEIDACYIYGSMDQEARTIAINNFRSGKQKIMVVTDLASRGIDIPLLDNVINFDFPSKPKVFVHRVGRAARAGRSGIAFSLVTPDEFPYFLDLNLFLGKQLTLQASAMNDSMFLGSIPQSDLDFTQEALDVKMKGSATLQALHKVLGNANKLYTKTKGVASSESYKRAKEMLHNRLFPIHPKFSSLSKEDYERESEMLKSIRNYKSNQTIFEVGNCLKDEANKIIHKRRQMFDEKIKSKKAQKADFEEPKPSAYKDEEIYLSYEKKEIGVEKGYSLGNDFLTEAHKAIFDISADDQDGLKREKSKLKWDKKKKNFVRTQDEPKSKMIRTESGRLIPATYRSNIFNDWKKKNHISLPRSGESELDGRTLSALKRNQQSIKEDDGEGEEVQVKKPLQRAVAKSELKNKDQIVKNRKMEERKRELFSKKQKTQSSKRGRRK